MVIRKSKRVSLYISCPTRVSQHYVIVRKGFKVQKKIDRKRQRFETVAIKQQDIYHKTYTEKFKSLGRVCYF